MTFQVSYGSHCLEIEDSASQVAQPLSPLAATLSDPVSAARTALTSPCDLPRLAEITVEGDQVVIAVGDLSPLLPEIAATVVKSLLEGPVTAEGIVLVTPAHHEAFAQSVRDAVDALLPPADRGKCIVQMHTPDEQETLAYLAASKEARPVYLNRLICEADMVVTLGVARPDSTFGYHGVHGSLYPTFADADARRRFDAPSNLDWPTHRRRRREEAAEAAFLAGILFTLQVIPGASGGAVEVLAGLAESVAPAAQAKADEVWSIDPPGAAELVVAAIDGGSTEQTWDNFARALFTARSMVTPHGAVVICSELDQPPSNSIRSLAALDGHEALQRHLHRERDADSAIASMLAHTLEQLNVFLMSGLDDSQLEDIGLAPLHNGEELQRLIDRSESSLLLPSAQHIALRPVQPAEIVVAQE